MTVLKNKTYLYNPETEYVKDNNIYCKTCNQPLLTDFELYGLRMRCSCRCKVDMIKREEDKAKRLEKRLSLRGLNNISIQFERYKRCTFENTELGSNESFMSAFFKSKEYCKKSSIALANGYGMYIFGGCGTGKTHLMACITNELERQLNTVCFTSLGEIVQKIRSEFGNSRSDGKTMADLTEVDFLVLDDLGTERFQTNDSDNWVQEKLYSIINARYNRMKPVLFTSNYSLNELMTKRGLSRKIVDRMFEMATVYIEIKGDSYRVKRRIAN